MPGGESETHLLLKGIALRWAREHGYRCGGLEVRVPNSNFRADVAAYRPQKQPREGGTAIGDTAIFECKSQRPDYLKDCRPEADTRDRLAACRARMDKLQRLLGTHHPELRRGETLFPEYDRHDFSDLAHQGYQKLVKEVATLERRLHGKTKFDRLSRYRCANALYAVVAPGIMNEGEVPVGWGLLELDSEEETLSLIRKPEWIETPERLRLELLQNIAAKGMWSARDPEAG
jgi:hypothetical protein